MERLIRRAVTAPGFLVACMSAAADHRRSVVAGPDMRIRFTGAPPANPLATR